jgi:hypothetical protein
MVTTLAGLTAKECWHDLAAAGIPQDEITHGMVRAWRAGRTMVGACMVSATATSDGAHSATYRITIP